MFAEGQGELLTISDDEAYLVENAGTAYRTTTYVKFLLLAGEAWLARRSDPCAILSCMHGIFSSFFLELFYVLPVPLQPASHPSFRDRC